MFEDIGGKIKGLTKIICWVEIIGCVVGAISCLSDGLVPIGCALLFGGPLVAWISSFMTYGFGELIESTAYIRDEISRRNVSVFKEHREVKQPTENHVTKQYATWKCAHCGQENSTSVGQCKSCGKFR